jgi:nucleotidyltransferase DUF2204
MADNASALPVTSSLEPEFDQAQRGFYREVLQLLNRHGIPYAVSGAFALQQHTGIWRVTKDLDVFLTAVAVPKALTVLAEAGFRCEIPDPVWLAKAHRGDFFVDLITGMSNAALFVTDEWIQRSRPAVVVDVSTRVLAPEELLASKLFVTRRERFDGADIAHVIYGTPGELDWYRVLTIIGEHWEILFSAIVMFRYIYPAKTHFVPAHIWKELITRFQKEIDNPDPAARFRGSLIDEKMFAIDVHEWQLDDILSEYRDRAQKITADPDACNGNFHER